MNARHSYSRASSLILSTLVIGAFFVVAGTLNKAQAADLTTVAPPCTFANIPTSNANRSHHSGPNFGKADDLSQSECNGSMTTLASISGYVHKGTETGACTGNPSQTFLEITSFDGDVKVRYLHGSYTATEGAYIEAGTPVGTMGTVGCSTGNHIHFEVKKNGVMLPYAEWEYGDYATTNPYRSSFNFGDSNTNTQGWTINNHLNYNSNADGGAIYNITGNDPILLSPRINLFTSDYSQLNFTITGSATGTNCGQVFFKTKLEQTFTEAKSYRFTIPNNVTDTNVQINLNTNSYWTGNSTTAPVNKVVQLRIDPCGGNGDAFRINNLSLTPASNAQKKPVYRFWSGVNNNHFMTASEDEKNTILKDFSRLAWTFENRVFYAVSNGSTCNTSYPGSVLAHRLVKPSNSSYFFTVDTNEKNSLVNSGPWIYEGATFCAFASSGTGRIPVYRFWNNTTQSHIFTANEAEKTSLQGNSAWAYEGVVFYVLPL